MPKVQYPQKFRDEWLNEKCFKDWLLKIENDLSKGRCRFCKCEVKAKRFDLVQHIKTKKHIISTNDFSTSRSITNYARPPTRTKSSNAEGTLCLYIAAHCSILSCDHLGVLCKTQFHDSEAGKDIKMHRTKCTYIICNTLKPHFEQLLMKVISNGPFSLLIDESTDISVLKFLGISVMYFNQNEGQIVSTYLALVEMEACDSDAITQAVTSTLREKGLNIKNMVGLGSDNASVMVGINNGVYQKILKEVPTLVHIPCVCHSLQLAVSAAANETLPRHIEYLIKETYNWFSHSSLRQAQYKNLYKAINDNHSPLKIVKSCDTRWLSIETAVGRILKQWIELKTLFGIARLNEKCYSAEILYKMYCDNNNLAYLTFLHPILLEIQLVNKSFESNSADPSKLLSDLTLLVRSVAKRFVNPYCREDPLITNMDSYVMPQMHFSKEFEDLIKDINKKDQHELKDRCLHFLKVLLKQFQQRLPTNIHILEKVSLVSVKIALRVVKEPLTPLMEMFKYETNIIDKVNHQWNNLTNIKWIEHTNTAKFWKEVDDYVDASGINPFNDLCKLSKHILVLPWSNADVERLFSQMNIVKTKLRNRMGPKLLDSILTIRSGLKRSKVCCADYKIPEEVLINISNSSYYPKSKTEDIDLQNKEDDLINIDNPIIF